MFKRTAPEPSKTLETILPLVGTMYVFSSNFSNELTEQHDSSSEYPLNTPHGQAPPDTPPPQARSAPNGKRPSIEATPTPLLQPPLPNLPGKESTALPSVQK